MRALGQRCQGCNLVVLMLAALAPMQAHAFGTEGHHLVAALAKPHLTARARAEIGRLLSFEPGSPMVSISTWADETRTPSTAAWQYGNIPRDAGAGRICMPYGTPRLSRSGQAGRPRFSPS